MNRVTALCIVLLALALGSTAQAQDDVRRENKEAPAPKAPTLTKPPKLIEATAPVYPEKALEAGLTADVKVRIHIDATGVVTKVEVVQPVGNGFDEAATEAAENYRFEPAEWDGVPGAIVVETAIHFTIQEEETPPPPPPPSPRSDEPDEAAVGPASHGGDYRLPVSIAGQAVERGTRRALSGIIVSIRELGIDAVTDEDGNFYFHGIPPGAYVILAVGERYALFERDLLVAEEDEKIEVRLWLRRKGGNPYETVVEGERERLEVTRRTLQRRQLTSVPGTFGDPVRVVQSLPGMARTPFITGFLLIRGSNPDDSWVFLDGHRIPLVYHFAGGPSVLNAEFLDRIDLYPGGFPARYGRAIGGIIAVDTRPAKSDGVHGSADIDLLDASAYVRVPVGENGSFALAGRRSYLDFMLGFFLPEPEAGGRLFVAPVYYDYQARFDYDFKSEGRVSVFFISSSDQLDVLSEDPDAEQSLALNTRIDFSRLIASYKRPLAADLEFTMSTALGRDSLVFSSGQSEEDSPFTDINIIQDTLSYRSFIKGRVNPRLAIEVGVDMEARRNRYDLFAPIGLAEVRDPISGQIEVPPEQSQLIIDSFIWAGYADLGWDVDDHLRLIPGLRFDNYLLDGEVRRTFDPRLVGRYKFDDDWLGKAYVGLFSQAPQAEGFNSQFGNPNLLLERALHIGAGGEWTPSKLWKIDAEVYFVDRYDIAAFSPSPVQDPETGRPIALFSSGIGDTVGLELLIKREVTDNLYGWLSYTLSKSVQQRRPTAEVRPTLFDQRHVLNAVASYTLDGGWEFGGRFRVVSGAPTTPVIGSTYNADSGGYRCLDGPDRGARLPTFHQLDVRAEKSWVFNYWSFGIYLDILNVYNATNTEAIQYDYRCRESAPVSSVPFVPTLGIRGKW